MSVLVDMEPNSRGVLKEKFTPDQKQGKPKKFNLLVYELCEGGNLYEKLVTQYETINYEDKQKVTPLGDDDILFRTFFQQIIDAIETSHKAGVLHRDLKPANVFLDKVMCAKVADFGLARAFEDDEKFTDTQGGTPGYMPPEIEMGRGNLVYTTKFDVWSAGYLLFLMYAATPPVQIADYGRKQVTDRDIAQWRRQKGGLELGGWVYRDWHCYQLFQKNDLFWQAHEGQLKKQYVQAVKDGMRGGRLPRRITFSGELKDLIEKMLAVDPNERITIQQVKQHPWYKGKTYTQEEVLGLMIKREKSLMTFITNIRATVKSQRGFDDDGKFQTEGTAFLCGVEEDIITSAAILEMRLWELKKAGVDSQIFGDWADEAPKSTYPKSINRAAQITTSRSAKQITSRLVEILTTDLSKIKRIDDRNKWEVVFNGSVLYRNSPESSDKSEVMAKSGDVVTEVQRQKNWILCDNKKWLNIGPEDDPTLAETEKGRGKPLLEAFLFPKESGTTLKHLRVNRATYTVTAFLEISTPKGDDVETNNITLQVQTRDTGEDERLVTFLFCGGSMPLFMKLYLTGILPQLLVGLAES